MKFRKHILGSVAPAALLVMSSSVVLADLLPDDVLIGTSGDGIVVVDEKEGVIEPGLKAVTFVRTRVSDGAGGWDYVEPFEEINTDFSDLDSRGDVTNCLMASNPDVYCDSAGGSGKRIKTYLTGRNSFDINLRTTPSATYSSVDYFSFGKVSNFTGARINGYTVELLDADGNSMGELAPEDAVLFNLDATDVGLGARLTDGLFGAGGQEGNIGFISEDRAGLSSVKTTDTLDFGGISNAEHLEYFGDSILDNSMVPDGIFWDDNDNPDDEGALVAWNNVGGGGWTYGNLDTAANIDARLSELAASLGVTVAELGYTAGGLVPEAIVAAAEANHLFEVEIIEDLRNANLNYTITVGTVDGGEVTIRITPKFAPIVNSAQSDLQFSQASYLDAAANVPYWDLGNAAVYQEAIDNILAMSAAERSQALNSIGFSFAPAFSNLGFEAARDQVNAITNYSVPWDQIATAGEDGDVVTQQSGDDSWEIGDGLYGHLSLGGARSSYSATAGSVAYDTDVTSFSLGLEKRIADTNSSFGLSLGSSNGSADAEQSLGSVDANGFSITAFSRTRFAEGGLLQALIGYQDLSYDSSRYVMGQTAKASTDGSQVFAALKMDYLQDMGSFKVGPTGSIEYYDVSVDGFTETGAGAWNQTVGGQSGTTVVGSIGVLGEYQMASASSDTRLIGSLQYTSLSGDDLVIQSGFAGMPGISFPVDGVNDDLLDVGLGFESVISTSATHEYTIQGAYRGAFGSEYESHALQLGLSMQF